MSLLSTVKAVPVTTERNKESVDYDFLEVAVAYCKHEVTHKQIAKALKIKDSTVMGRVFAALKSGVRTGELKLK